MNGFALVCRHLLRHWECYSGLVDNRGARLFLAT